MSQDTTRVSGLWLAELRKRSGMKAKDLALALGITPQTWSRYENNHSPIPKTVALAALYVSQEHGRPLPASERLALTIREIVSDYVASDE